jgi:carboxylesterase type B
VDYELPPAIVPSVLQVRVAPYAAAGPILQRLYASPAAYDHYLSDAIFAEAASYIARLHAAREPTFRYRFSIFPQSLRAMSFTGAFHSMEGGYVFGTLGEMPWAADVRDHELSALVSAYWVAFAASGSPDHAGAPAWPRAADGMILNFTREGALPVRDDRQAVLDGLTDAYGHHTLPLVIGADARSARQF